MAGSIGSLGLKLWVDDTKLQDDLSKTASNLKKFGTDSAKAFSGWMNSGSMGGLISGVTTAVGAIKSLGGAVMDTGKWFMDFADNDAAKSVAALTRLARVTGSTTEELAGLQFITGQDTDSFTKSMGQLIKNLAGVGAESKGAQEHFAKFGLDLKQLGNMGAVEAIMEIADAFQNAKDSGDKAQLALLAQSKGWLEGEKALSKGRAGIKEAIGKAGAFGLGFSGAQGKDVAEAVRAVKEFKMLKEGFSRQMVINLAPIALPVAKMFTEVGLGLMKGLKQAWTLAKPFKDLFLGLMTSVGKGIGGTLGDWASKAATALGKATPLIKAFATATQEMGANVVRWSKPAAEWLEKLSANAERLAADGNLVTQAWQSTAAVFAAVDQIVKESAKGWDMLNVATKGVVGAVLSFVPALELLRSSPLGLLANASSDSLDKMKTNLLGFLAYVEFGATHFSDLWKLSFLKAGAWASEFWDQGRAIFKAFPELAAWAAQTFADAFKVAFDGITKNFSNLKDSIANFLKDPSGGFNFQWSSVDIKAVLDNAKKDVPKITVDESDITKKLRTARDLLSDKVGKDFLAFSRDKTKQWFGKPPPEQSHWFSDLFEGKDKTPEKIEPLKLAQAAVRGSKEAVAAEMRFRAENRGDPVLNLGQQQLAEQKKTNNKLDDVRKLLDGRGSPVIPPNLI